MENSTFATGTIVHLFIAGRNPLRFSQQHWSEYLCYAGNECNFHLSYPSISLYSSVLILLYTPSPYVHVRKTRLLVLKRIQPLQFFTLVCVTHLAWGECVWWTVMLRLRYRLLMATLKGCWVYSLATLHHVERQWNPPVQSIFYITTL